MQSDIYLGAVPYAVPLEALSRSVYCASFTSKGVFRLQRTAGDYFQVIGMLILLGAASFFVLWIVKSNFVSLLLAITMTLAGAAYIVYGRSTASKGTLGEGVYCVKIDTSKMTAAVQFYRVDDLENPLVLCTSSSIDLQIAPCLIPLSNSRWHACMLVVQNMRCILACHDDLDVLRKYLQALPGKLPSQVRESQTVLQIRASRRLV